MSRGSYVCTRRDIGFANSSVASIAINLLTLLYCRFSNVRIFGKGKKNKSYVMHNWLANILVFRI